jgi:hypothetical protein
VSAVIGPTPGTVLRFFSRSRSSGSRSRELIKAYSVLCSRTMVSRLSFSNGRMLSSTSWLLSSNSRKYFTLCNVVTHSGFHQEARDPILHLNHLAYQQVTIAQGAAPIPNLRGSQMALGQEIAPQAVRNLAGIDPVVLLLGG